MASTDYEITDHIKFFSDARFAQSKTTTFLAGTNASTGWEVTVPYNAALDSPVLPGLNYTDPAVVAAVMANPGAYANPTFRGHGHGGRVASGAGQHGHPAQQPCTHSHGGSGCPSGRRIGGQLTAPWVLETFPLNSFGRRATIDEVVSWQIETGFRFDLPVKDWTGEVYYSRGESSTYNVAQGNNSLARWREMVQTADYGRGAALNANDNHLGNPSAPGSSESGLRHRGGSLHERFLRGRSSTAMRSRLTIASTPCRRRCRLARENQQDIVELNFQGGLVDLPAGELRTAFGYQSRRNSALFNPDILQSTASFRDQVIGVYPTGYLDAETSVQRSLRRVADPGAGWLQLAEELRAGHRRPSVRLQGHG